MLTGAAVTDLWTRRISNWWIVLWMTVGIVLVRADFFLPMLCVLLLSLFLFLARMMGAGDIKLMAVTAGFLGAGRGARVLAAGLVFAAAVALLKMIIHKSLWKRLIIFADYVGQAIQTGRITAYYEPVRDGTEAVMSVAPCLLLGYLFILMEERWCFL